MSPLPYAPLSAAAIDGLKPGYVLYLGRIVPEKNLEVLIRAHAASRIPGDLVITGEHGHAPAYLAAMTRLADDLSPGRVRFTGSRFGAAKAALLHNARVVACPSRIEGLPLAVLEAMSCARIVVASDIAHRELLPAGCGVLVATDGVGAWSIALRSAVDGACDGVGDSAAERARAVYGWEPIADRTLKLYRDVLVRRSPRAGATLPLRSRPGRR